MKLYDSNIKKFLIFSEKKVFLYDWETKTSKKFHIFAKIECPCNSGKGTFLYFRELRS